MYGGVGGGSCEAPPYPHGRVSRHELFSMEIAFAPLPSFGRSMPHLNHSRQYKYENIAEVGEKIGEKPTEIRTVDKPRRRERHGKREGETL